MSLRERGITVRIPDTIQSAPPLLEPSGDVFVAPTLRRAIPAAEPRSRKDPRLNLSEEERAERTQTGKLFQKFRGDHRVLRKEFSRLSGIDDTTLTKFESGNFTYMGASMIERFFKGIEKISLDDPRVEELDNQLINFLFPKEIEEKRRLTNLLEEIESTREERRWFRTLYNVGFPMGVKYLRAYQGKTQEEMSQETGIVAKDISDVELGVRKPLLYSVNQIINFGELDFDGRAAKLMRLQSSMGVLSIQDVSTTSLNKLIKYLRVQKGKVQKEVADELGVAEMTINRWETGRVKPSSDGLNAFIHWLGLPEDSPLTTVLKQKATNPTMHFSLDFLESLLNDAYLFVDERYPIRWYIPLGREREILDQLDASQGTFRNMLTLVSAAQPEVIQEVGIQLDHIPEDTRIARFLERLDISIHSDLAYRVFHLAEMEREKTHRGRVRRRS